MAAIFPNPAVRAALEGAEVCGRTTVCTTTTVLLSEGVKLFPLEIPGPELVPVGDVTVGDDDELDVDDDGVACVVSVVDDGLLEV